MLRMGWIGMSKTGWTLETPRTRLSRLAPWVLVGGGLVAMVAILFI
jgi:hypothetical protein